MLFCRFKKKSLKLAYFFSTEELADILKEIKNKKLFQTLLKDDLHCSLYEEKAFKAFNDTVNSIIKLNKS